MKTLLLLVALCAAALLSGCSAEDEVDRARDRLAERTERLRRDVRREYREQREKVKGRVQEYLAQLEQAIPSALPQRRPVGVPPLRAGDLSHSSSRSVVTGDPRPQTKSIVIP